MTRVREKESRPWIFFQLSWEIRFQKVLEIVRVYVVIPQDNNLVEKLLAFEIRKEQIDITTCGHEVAVTRFLHLGITGYTHNKSKTSPCVLRGQTHGVEQFFR